MNRSNRPSGTPDEDKTQAFRLDDLLGDLEQSASSKTPVLVCLTGRMQGKVYRLAADSVDIGRDGEHIRIDEDGVSRHHARIDRTDAGFALVDVGSTNGTLRNAERLERQEPVELCEGDRIRLGPTVVLRFEMHDDLDQSARERLYVLATRDALTGAFNRRVFEERIQSEWTWHKRHRQPCSLLALDIDFFKRINDTWGHPAGDAVLQDLAKLLSNGIRTEDLFARIGGEEFVILMRLTPKQVAVPVAERLRASVEAQAFLWNGARMPVNISCGVAASDEPDMRQWKDLTRLADERLYAAKRSGRNRVEE